MYYDSAAIYIESATDLNDKITRMNAVISALESAALAAAAGEDILEYSLDDGQTKIKTVRRGLAGIEQSILGFERLKQRYINQLQGRGMRLVDGKNFIPHNGHC